LGLEDDGVEVEVVDGGAGVVEADAIVFVV
jgi:hypothetical protein